MTLVLLETERLRLRAFTTDDEDNIVHLDSDPEVLRFINGGHPTSRAFVREYEAAGPAVWDGDDVIYAIDARSPRTD